MRRRGQQGGDGVDVPAESARGIGLAAAGGVAVGLLAVALDRGAVGFKTGLFAAGGPFLGWGVLRAKPRPPNAGADTADRRETAGTETGGLASSVRFSASSVDADRGAAVRWLLAGGALLLASFLLELAGVGA
jgi:hypothetical protein